MHDVTASVCCRGRGRWQADAKMGMPRPLTRVAVAHSPAEQTEDIGDEGEKSLPSAV
jgi:hypothetical protein